MAHDLGLRPIERRVLRLVESGVDDREIAWRLRRTPRFVRQVRHLAHLPNRRPLARSHDARGLRPIERCVLKWRDSGATPDELAARFRRGVPFLRQVETLARYKLTNGA